MTDIAIKNALDLKINTVKATTAIETLRDKAYWAKRSEPSRFLLAATTASIEKPQLTSALITVTAAQTS
ncbi:hypothetical protein IV56_GL000134 [Lacticaseibacillus saniviri JCM 17471 = DSM 24301]|uniref:Uncharacterized protein n=1 Tax=Lacticaseibacillus saniviri JCM 17471 = DSM 24301 TaxID=1293598 RepID=A0A0R2MVW0_9LACO|nr:hypothetical protein IV56_GL000134 [Lacticaseibacillus saniviri JCM 17471 = DSM 24301]